MREPGGERGVDGGGGRPVEVTFANVAVITFGAFIVTTIAVALPVALPRQELSFASTFANAVNLTWLPAV